MKPLRQEIEEMKTKVDIVEKPTGNELTIWLEREDVLSLIDKKIEQIEKMKFNKLKEIKISEGVWAGNRTYAMIRKDVLKDVLAILREDKRRVRK